MASSIKGLDKLLSGLDRASVKFQGDVKDIISVNIGDIELMAQRLASNDDLQTEHGVESEEDIRKANNWPDAVYNSISSEIYPNGYGGRVFVNDRAGDVAAWREFGTGQSAARYLATVPEYWRAVASKYIRNKQGTIIGKPFMLPSHEKYSIETVKEIKQAMKDIKL